MMDARDIRSWCMAHPRPKTLRLQCGADQKLFQVLPTQTWAQIGRSVAAMEPDMLEALDDKGAVLRATRLTDELDDDDDEPAAAAPVAVGEDAETRRYRIFVDAIKGAYEHANGTAFDKLVSITDAVGRRADGLESRLAMTESALRRAYDANADLTQEVAEVTQAAASDPVGAFVQAAVQGAMQKQQAEAQQTNGSNGKPKKGN